jgi:hypothetical protein
MATAKKATAPKAPAKKTRNVTPRTKAHLAKVRPVTITLTMSHMVNGKSYGPGTVKVSPSMAREFQYQEERAVVDERRLNERRSHMIVQTAGGRYRHLKVAPEHFDQMFNNPTPGMLMTF